MPWLRWGWWELTRVGCRRGRKWLCYFSSWRGMWSQGRCWCISESIYQILPVFVIKSEVWPRFQWTKYIYYWNVKSNVLPNGFLVEWSTPPTRNLLLHHAVRSFVGSCSSELQVTFHMKVSCFATWFWIVGISIIFWRIVSFVILFSFTCIILMSSILLMIRCKKTSSSSRSEMCSHILIVEYVWVWQGILSTCYGGWRMCLSKNDSMLPLKKKQRWVFCQHCSQSRRLYVTNIPRYMNCFVNVTKPSETVTLFVSFASSYSLYSRCLFCLSLYFSQVW